MPTTPPFSYVTYTVNSGSLAVPEFSYGNIDLLEASVTPVANQLEVYLNDVILTPTTDYTFISGSKVDISAPLVIGDLITIKRNTEKGTRYVDFIDNAFLTERDLDLSYNQIFFMAQEAFDNSYNTIRTIPAGTKWTGQGKEITLIAPATSGNSAVTYDQMVAYATGGYVAAITPVTVGYDGGGNDQFALPAELLGSDPSKFMVTVNGILQEPDGGALNNSPGEAVGYTVETVGGVPMLTFPSPIPAGSSVSIRILPATVVTTLADGAVVTASIADDSVTLDKLGFASGLANRFVVVDTAGVPTLNQFTTSYITNFNAAVTAYRLDQFTAPTGSVSFNSQKITSLADGTTSTDAINKGQLDSAIAAATSGVVTIYTGEAATILSGSQGSASTQFNAPNNKAYDILEIEVYCRNNTTGVTYHNNLLVDSYKHLNFGSDGNISKKCNFLVGATNYTFDVNITRNTTNPRGFTLQFINNAVNFTTFNATFGNTRLRYKYTTLT